MSIPTSLTFILAAFLSNGPPSILETRLTVVEYTVADWVAPVSPCETKCEDALMSHIRKKVAPMTWTETGGYGTMTYDSKAFRLTVRQTLDVHEELKTFLEQLTRQPTSTEVRLEQRQLMRRSDG